MLAYADRLCRASLHDGCGAPGPYGVVFVNPIAIWFASGESPSRPFAQMT